MGSKTMPDYLCLLTQHGLQKLTENGFRLEAFSALQSFYYFLHDIKNLQEIWAYRTLRGSRIKYQ